MRPDLGLVSIGQTPRPDLEALFRAHAPSATIATHGALDGLDHDEVAELARVGGSYPLLVRLSDGSSAEVDRAVLLPYVVRCAADLAAAGARLVVVICAGDFPMFACEAPVLRPGVLLPAVVGAVSQTRRIGVVTPNAGQVDAARAKWAADGFDVTVTSAAPGDAAAIATAAEVFQDETLDLVLLDCMGHGPSDRAAVAARCRCPVLMAQTIVAKIASELTRNDHGNVTERHGTSRNGHGTGTERARNGHGRMAGNIEATSPASAIRLRKAMADKETTAGHREPLEPLEPFEPLNPMTTSLNGVFNITPTPFRPDGSLDVESLATLTNFLVDKEVDGLTILGVLGEVDKVSEAERAQIISGVVEAADGRIPICVGCSHPASTDRAVAFSREAERLGARALMVAPPKLARATDATLRRHYLEIASAVTIPVVIQDHPASSGVFMSVDLLAAIGDEAAHCRFVKLEDEPSPPKITRLLERSPDVGIFGGLGGIMCLEELRHGASGIMTGFAYPEVLVDIYRRHQRGDRDGAADVFYRYCPLIRFETQPRINLPLRKHVYQRRGAIASSHARLPVAALDEGTIADLDDLLRRLGLE